MKVKRFEIKFDNPRGVFEAEKTLSGAVHLHLLEPMKLRSIKLYFVGDGKTFWEKKHGKHKDKYRARESYLNNVVTFVHADATEGSVKHPAGDHVYPFCIALQGTIPSSFEGTAGYVRYFCKATIDRPWKSNSHVKRVFTVIHHLDLNGLPVAAPFYKELSQEIEGCCCSDGNVNVSLELNKTGYVPGEPIVYTITIDNNTSSAVQRVTLELRQITTCFANKEGFFAMSSSLKQKEFKHAFFLFNGRTVITTCFANKEGFFAMSSSLKQKEFKHAFFLFNGRTSVLPQKTGKIHKATTVPSLPPSKLDGCKIIDLKYFVILKLPGGFGSVKMEKEIIIGTIPIMEPLMLPSAPAVDPASTAPGGPVEPSAPVMAPPSYDEALATGSPVQPPPPSYEDCVFGTSHVRDEDDEDNTDGDVMWAPSYPYYDWSQHNTLTYGGEPPSQAQMGPKINDDDPDDAGNEASHL